MTTGGNAILSLIGLSIVLALPIAELVIGAKYLDSGDGCANAQVMSPAMWLFVCGIVSISLIVTTICTTVRIILSSGGREVEMVLYVVLRIISSMFSIAWCIVGAIVLWRDNNDCSPRELHDMMWASVIIHLVGAAALVFGSKNSDNR